MTDNKQAQGVKSTTETLTTTGEETSVEVQVMEGDYSLKEVTDKIMPEKEFNHNFEKAVKLTGQFRDTIHALACQALYYARVHNDYARATLLIQMQSEGLSPNMTIQLRRWFIAFGPFRWVKTDDTKVKGGYKFRKSNSADANVFNIKLAEKTPFWEIERMTEDEVTDLIHFESKGIVDRVRRAFNDALEVEKLLTESPDKVEISEQDKKDLPEMLEDMKTFLHKWAGVESTKKKAA